MARFASITYKEASELFLVDELAENGEINRVAELKLWWQKILGFEAMLVDFDGQKRCRRCPVISRVPTLACGARKEGGRTLVRART